MAPNVAHDPSDADDAEEERASTNEQPSSKGKSSKPSSLASALSGALSGMLIGACLQPLDVVRTRMQGDSAHGISRSAIATCKNIVAQQGLRGLWAGTGPTVIRMGMGVGLHMVLVENMGSALSKQLDSGLSHLSNINAMLASGISRGLASTLLCPIAVAKTRMEYSGQGAIRYVNTFDALSTIARTEGVRGLFKGLLPTLLTNAPFSGLYYMFYVRLKENLAGEGRSPVLVNFSSGVLAAVAATFLTQPFDVIRTRMQLTKATAMATGSPIASATETIAALRFATQQGPKALFVGTWPRVLKRTGQTALVWTLYEELAPRMTAAFVGIVATIEAQRKGGAGGGEGK